MKGPGMDVLCLGLVITDVLVKLKHNSTSFNEDVTMVHKISLSSGGNALNSAFALSKLGMNTGISGKVGCDYFRDFLINVMKEHSCDIRGVKCSKFLPHRFTIPGFKRSKVTHFGNNP